MKGSGNIRKGGKEEGLAPRVQGGQTPLIERQFARRRNMSCISHRMCTKTFISAVHVQAYRVPRSTRTFGPHMQLQIPANDQKYTRKPYMYIKETKINLVGGGAAKSLNMHRIGLYSLSFSLIVYNETKQTNKINPNFIGQLCMCTVNCGVQDIANKR